MSHRIGNVTVICETPPRQCETCGEVKETRPYGPNGQEICYDCAMKNPKATNARMDHVLYGDELPI